MSSNVPITEQTQTVACILDGKANSTDLFVENLK